MADTIRQSIIVVETRRRTGRLQQLVVRSAAVLSVGFVVVVVVRFAVLVSVRHKTAGILARLDRDDPGWRCEEIDSARKLVPEATNSATPILAANRLIPPRWPEILATAPRMGASPDDPCRVIVPLIETENFPTPDDKQVVALRAELALLAPVLAELRQVVDKPVGRYRLVWARNPLETPTPQTLDAQNAALLLKLDAILKIHDGDLEAALASSRAILNVARSLGDEPLLISQQVRIEVGTSAIRSIQRVLAAGEVSDGSLRVIQDLLETEEAHPTLFWALRGERAVLNDLFARLASGEIQLDGAKMPSWIHWFAGESMSIYDQGLALDQMGKAIAIPRAKLSEQTALGRAWDQEQSRMKEAGGWSGEVSKQMPEILPFVESYVIFKARLRVAIVAIASERYRLKHGQWPSSPGQLTPWPLVKVPDNPQTDRPLSMMSSKYEHAIFVDSPAPAPGRRNWVRELLKKKTLQDRNVGFWLRDLDTRHPSKSPD